MSDTVVTSRCRLQVTDACKAEGGTPLSGLSGMCMACYRACCRPCLTCQEKKPNRRATLRFEYQEHDWDGTGDCPRCRKAGVKHRGFTFQAPCPECKGERVIFEVPKK